MPKFRPRSRREVTAMLCYRETILDVDYYNAKVSMCVHNSSLRTCLHQLKNWLRTTMTQQQLNAVYVCHVNKDILDKLVLTELAADFARRSTIRQNIFGDFRV